ncbi:MAG: Asp-tRNA(Asn)/Glu-tRNA(Gln) amidotransferase subunit GatC [Desulfovibrio sp.]|jgi:aspartyl-tRNA(Asn)/glutamyl-tRNA(Gln) amidotransferase subunit C|nr:Asp-tRNA(Asn)/Glu-tRNA(Gln) amidotransferase subunit GatC [Desulfovibrio sp.]
MPVSKEQVLATAALCRLDLSVSSAHARPENPEERTARIASQLDAVVGYMDILNRVDTSQVEPLYSPLRQHVAPPRPDVVEKRLSAEEVTANAPMRQQCFFAVPPVI